MHTESTLPLLLAAAARPGFRFDFILYGVAAVVLLVLALLALNFGMIYIRANSPPCACGACRWAWWWTTASHAVQVRPATSAIDDQLNVHYLAGGNVQSWSCAP
jgi:hypothetical protein